MKKIIYITLTLIIFSSLTASAQFWKKNKKETEEVIEKKAAPAKPIPAAVVKEKVVQKPKEKSAEPLKKTATPTIKKPTKKKSYTKQKKNNASQPELDSGTIEQQFDYIITKSTRFKEFQLIRKSSILKVKEHAVDSLNIVRNDLNTSTKAAAELETTIKQLNGEIETLKTENKTISTQIDNVSLFGASLSKASYGSIVWSIIVALLLALIFFIIQFKRNSLITSRSNNDLTKIENEFEAFRKKSLKKEQETMRKLQDELNRNRP